MASKIRISSNTIRPFYGNRDVVAGISKIKVKAVVRLQGIDDVACLMALYIEGSMLVLCLEKDKKDQLSAAKIEQCLKEAYMERM